MDGTSRQSSVSLRVSGRSPARAARGPQTSELRGWASPRALSSLLRAPAHTLPCYRLFLQWESGPPASAVRGPRCTWETGHRCSRSLRGLPSLLVPTLSPKLAGAPDLPPLPLSLRHIPTSGPLHQLSRVPQHPPLPPSFYRVTVPVSPPWRCPLAPPSPQSLLYAGPTPLYDGKMVSAVQPSSPVKAEKPVEVWFLGQRGEPLVPGGLHPLHGLWAAAPDILWGLACPHWLRPLLPGGHAAPRPPKAWARA